MIYIQILTRLLPFGVSEWVDGWVGVSEWVHEWVSGYAYPSSIILSWSEICIEKCLNKQNVWAHKLRIVYCFKNVIRKKLLDLIAFVYKQWQTYCMTYHLSYKEIGHFMGRVAVYCNLNSNMVDDVGCPALAARQRHGGCTNFRNEPLGI